MIGRPPRSTLLPCTTRFRSAPSTSVHAAQLITASGLAAATIARVAAASRTSTSRRDSGVTSCPARAAAAVKSWPSMRTEEHTYELQAPQHLVSSLLLQKKSD